MFALCLLANANAAPTNTFMRNGRAGWLWRDATGTPVIWQFDGTERVTSTSLTNVADPGWAIAAAADFDGDHNRVILPCTNDNATKECR